MDLGQTKSFKCEGGLIVLVDLLQDIVSIEASGCVEEWLGIEDWGCGVLGEEGKTGEGGEVPWELVQVGYVESLEIKAGVRGGMGISENGVMSGKKNLLE